MTVRVSRNGNFHFPLPRFWKRIARQEEDMSRTADHPVDIKVDAG
jgi:hypothetical protein